MVVPVLVVLAMVVPMTTAEALRVLADNGLRGEVLTVSNDDERDFAEESYNAASMCDESEQEAAEAEAFELWQAESTAYRLGL